MFDDFEQAMAEDGKQRRRFCGFGRWVRTLEPEHRAKAEDLVGNRDWDCRALARYFQGKGATFNDQVINRHRNASCCGQAK